MGRWGVRPITTTFTKPPGKRSKQTRIRIPQPVERPFSIHGKDLVQWEQLRPEADDFTLHKHGVYRQKLEEDPRERRAVSHSVVRGTLPERIVYQYLTQNLHMVADADFTFQTSMDGGRMTMGGIVADFVFENLKLVLNVQGSTHSEFLRIRKDDEQESILADMGYTLIPVWEDDIYDEYGFDTLMRKIFLKGESQGESVHGSEVEDITDFDLTEWLHQIQEILVLVENINV